jgi:hypothetical protein
LDIVLSDLALLGMKTKNDHTVSPFRPDGSVGFELKGRGCFGISEQTVLWRFLPP